MLPRPPSSPLSFIYRRMSASLYLWERVGVRVRSMSALWLVRGSGLRGSGPTRGPQTGIPDHAAHRSLLNALAPSPFGRGLGRGLAGAQHENESPSLRRSLSEENNNYRLGQLIPHPNPLPEGEGIAEAQAGRVRLSAVFAFCLLLSAFCLLPSALSTSTRAATPSLEDRGSSPRVSTGVNTYALPDSRATAPASARASADSLLVTHNSEMEALA